MEDVRKWDHNILREETSLGPVSPTSTQKNPNNRVLPSTCFTKLPSFDRAAPLAVAGGAGSQGRQEERLHRPGCAPSGTGAQLPLQPSGPSRYEHRPTGLRLQPLPTGTERAGASRLWNRRPQPPGSRQPGRGPPAAGHGATAAGSSSAPLLPAVPEEEKPPRTHSPRQPRAAQRSVSSSRRCQPGPSPSGPPWACRDLKFGAGPRGARGAAVRPLPAELRGVPAVLLRSGRAANAAP